MMACLLKKHLFKVFWGIICGILMLEGTALGQPTGQSARDIFVILDTSGSMRGHCGSTCMKCNKHTPCPDGYFCKWYRCRMNPDLQAHACADIWDNVIANTKKYLHSLPLGTSIRIFTFNRAGNRPVELRFRTHTIGPDSLHDMERALDRLNPRSQCTYLYDIIWRVLDKMTDSPPEHRERQLLFVFTDGNDDGSTRKGLDLKRRLGKISQSGRFTWVISKPHGALDALCNGVPNCVEGNAREPNWDLTPKLTLDTKVLGLSNRTAKGTLHLVQTQKGLFPYELSIRFVPDTVEAGKLLEFRGPSTIELSSGDASLEWLLKPDFSITRPARISGKLVLTRLNGNVILSSSRIPVTFALKQAKYIKYDIRGGVFDNPEGTSIKIQLPDEFWSKYQTESGFHSMQWRIGYVAGWKKAKIGKPLITLGKTDLSRSREIPINISSHTPLVDRKGFLTIGLVDKGGWTKLGMIHIPVKLETGCINPPCGGNEGGSSSIGLWILIIIIGAILVAVFFFVRYPDVSGFALSIETPLGEPEIIRPIRNGPLRLLKPVGQVSLAQLADSEELRNWDTGGSGVSVPDAKVNEGDVLDDISGLDNESAADEQISGLRSSKIKVTMDKKGTIVLKAPFRVFRKDTDKDLNDKIRVASIGGGRVLDSVSFHILEKGPKVQAIDLHTGNHRV